ncbi:MAG: hypothetical protein K2O41_06225 [Clostridia bacterium]|nr:hypothetical protein [Clostridia bacterium]
MPNIITPTTLCDNFDDSLDLTAITLKETVSDGVKLESVSFLGRETGDGRVKIFGVFASDEKAPAAETVLILPDSTDGIDTDLLKLFVKRGYSAFMVDYRGEWEDTEFCTLYPSVIDYANASRCGRRKDFVDDSADKTCWFEWVAVGIYAQKYIKERTLSNDIAVLGIRDGGEVAWKLGVAKQFSCIVTACAAGWKAYSGMSKYKPVEQELDEERYRFIGGIDSQAYAPYVKSPVLMLCSTNDGRFDYDRAYDTFSRINHEFADDSVITYSVRCDASIDSKSTDDMFMFLNKHLKHRQVFIPKPAELNVTIDVDDNLIANLKFDSQGIVEDYGMFLAEDSIDSSVRDWTACEPKRKISETEHEFFLDIYDKTSTIFVLGFARYTNGFTIWSKIAVKKISGSFRNTVGKCRVLYSSREGVEGFKVADPRTQAHGGIFFTDDVMVPQLVTKAKGIKGIYSVCGLTTYRINNPKFAPVNGNVLKIDIFCDSTQEVLFSLDDVESGETYKYSQSVLGGVWQSILLKSKLFKTVNGVALDDYVRSLKFCITCEGEFAVNNVMWL